MIRCLPSIMTGARLALLPVLVYLVSDGSLTYGAALFLVLLLTDLLDGRLARRLGSSSKFGAYFDATTDFVLVFSMFLVFDSRGFVPNWVVLMIALFFGQFIVTSLHWERIYDPVGKYYGSLLYGAIGLRFLVSGPFFSDITTVIIAGYTAASISARILYLSLITKTPGANGEHSKRFGREMAGKIRRRILDQ